MRNRLMAAVALTMTAGQVASQQIAPQAAANAENLKVLDHFADCIVTLHHAAVVDAIRHIAKQEDVSSLQLGKLSDSRCVESIGRGNTTMSVDRNLLIYAIGTALFRRDYADSDLLSKEALPPLDELTFYTTERKTAILANITDGDKKAKLDHILDNSNTAVLQLSMGECVVRKDPGAAYALLTAGSKIAEHDQFKALSETLTSCLSEIKYAPTQIKFQQVILKYAISLGYDRYALAVKDAARKGS